MPSFLPFCKENSTVWLHVIWFLKWKWSHSVISDSLWPHGLYSLPGSYVHRIFEARILECFQTFFSHHLPLVWNKRAKTYESKNKRSAGESVPKSIRHSLFYFFFWRFRIQGWHDLLARCSQVQIPSRAGSKGKWETDEGPGLRRSSRWRVKASWMFWDVLATFFFFCTTAEMEGTCWKEVVWLVSVCVNAPLTFFMCEFTNPD